MTDQTAAPIPPEIVSAILRDPDSPLFPSRIAVFCDECGFTESGEYMVSEEQTKAERLEVARAHLRKRGWQCDEDGDFCREHAGSPVEEIPAAAAPRIFTPDVVTVDADGRKHTTIKVKRCCNGCGQYLGDVTDAEINRAIAGAAQDDVRGECAHCRPLVELEAQGCTTWQLTPSNYGFIDHQLDRDGIFTKAFTEYDDDRVLQTVGMRVGVKPGHVVARFGDWLVRHPDGGFTVHAAPTPV